MTQCAGFLMENRSDHPGSLLRLRHLMTGRVEKWVIERI
ncbi:hypothetical protein GTPT_2034 [Tatumella ptyseos ATCC 33301]|uniref:Uncharacterized protein n=1 Tax=Tatumella ptyseos ATCC 33301 TaxID=1005995 RepID=A0A085JE40_9GAMM|nr:hypothetical protein GTPT_2034 [Tatumella ptyseos ATCC 33301]